MDEWGIFFVSSMIKCAHVRIPYIGACRHLDCLQREDVVVVLFLWKNIIAVAFFSKN